MNNNETISNPTSPKMTKVTKELYKANIPKECSYQTIEEHVDKLMFCNRLIHRLENYLPMSCDACEFSINNKQLKEQQC